MTRRCACSPSGRPACTMPLLMPCAMKIASMPRHGGRMRFRRPFLLLAGVACASAIGSLIRAACTWQHFHLPLSVPFSASAATTGWYYGNWLWQFRGFIDLLMGGVGMRRGRRDSEQLHAGDTLDCWRVESVRTGTNAAPCSGDEAARPCLAGI